MLRLIEMMNIHRTIRLRVPFGNLSHSESFSRFRSTEQCRWGFTSPRMKNPFAARSMIELSFHRKSLFVMPSGIQEKMEERDMKNIKQGIILGLLLPNCNNNDVDGKRKRFNFDRIVN
jgi:hypothetical protein